MEELEKELARAKGDLEGMVRDQEQSTQLIGHLEECLALESVAQPVVHTQPFTPLTSLQRGRKSACLWGGGEEAFITVITFIAFSRRHNLHRFLVPLGLEGCRFSAETGPSQGTAGQTSCRLGRSVLPRHSSSVLLLTGSAKHTSPADGCMPPLMTTVA